MAWNETGGGWGSYTSEAATCYAWAMLGRSALGVSAALALVALSARADAATPETPRWTGRTPDEIVERSARRAAAGGSDALARLLFAYSLAPEADAGRAKGLLAALGRSPTPLGDTAHWLARSLEPAPPARGAGSYDGPLDEGMVRTFAILGPLEDTGGGLLRREGVEVPGFRFVGGDLSRGAFVVRPTRTRVGAVNAGGVALDRYIEPRRESCSYLATAVKLPGAAKLELRVAASGTVRVAWDGLDAGASLEHHRRALLDRIATAIDATAGEHLLVVKVCSSAQHDEGRVRVRLLDGSGAPAALTTSSDPGRLDAALARASGQAPQPLRPVRTPFEEATTLSEPATMPGSLHAAMVRILAGADDLQSPRAPGMLGLLAATHGVDAETLALVGFLAPSGANRSGWLRRARIRAAEEGDTDAAAFSQRALVLAQLGALQIDLARATSEEAPLASAFDPQAELIRAEIQARMGNQGLRLAATAKLERLAKERGGKTPESVLRSLAQFTQADRPALHLEAMRALVALAPGYRGPEHVRAHRHLGSAAMAAVALSDWEALDGARSAERIATRLVDAGELATARTLFLETANDSPNRSLAHLGVARTLQAMRSKDERTIQAALARARELEPGNVAVSSELAFRLGQSSATIDAGADAEHLVPPAVFLARGRAKPLPKEGILDRQLHWRRVVRMLEDKRISQTIHYAREIGLEPRNEQERYENVPEAGLGSELLLARVHRADGTVLEPEVEDASGATIRWPKLRRGDVVEVAIRSFTPGPVGRRGDAPFYFLDYVGSVATRPVLYNEVVIDAPVGSPLAYDVVGGKPDRRTEERRGERRITSLVWDAPPTIADEPLAPPPSETLPVVVGSIYPTWKHFLDWYRGAVDGFTVPDEQIKQVARELTLGKTTREARLEALFNYVADDIRYVNYQSGEWWLPNRPQHLLARRQGDCDDKANLLISLLAAADIQATEVLIQTRFTGQPRILFESKIAIPMFDHGIVFLPEGTGGRFLDPTSPQSRLGTLPAMDARAAAVLVSDGEVKALPTPRSSPDEHGVIARWTVELDANGGAAVVANEEHVGDSAFLLRSNLGQADARAQWVEANLLARSLAGAKLDGEVAFDGNLPKGAARVEYRASAERLARREGREFVLTLAPPTPLAMQFAPLAERTLPVVLPPRIAPSHHDATIEVTLPKGWKVVALPPDDALPADALGSARQSFAITRKGRALQVTRSLRFDASRIEPDSYPRWRAWLRDVDRMMRRSVRIAPSKE